MKPCEVIESSKAPCLARDPAPESPEGDLKKEILNANVRRLQSSL